MQDLNPYNQHNKDILSKISTLKREVNFIIKKTHQQYKSNIHVLSLSDLRSYLLFLEKTVVKLNGIISKVSLRDIEYNDHFGSLLSDPSLANKYEMENRQELEEIMADIYGPNHIFRQK